MVPSERDWRNFEILAGLVLAGLLAGGCCVGGVIGWAVTRFVN
jgi:hypothetical protein